LLVDDHSAFSTTFCNFHTTHNNHIPTFIREFMSLVNFYASWIFRCPRWIYLKLRYPEKEIIDENIKKMGDFGERIAKEFLSRKYRIFHGKRRFLEFDEFRIVGKADFKVLTPQNSFEIVEVKRVKRLRRFPMARWIAQLNLYMAMESISSGFILEVSDDRIRKGNWRFSKNLFKKSVQYYRDVKEMMDNGDPMMKRSECWNCSYKHLCEGMW
jgi:CRISPR-associated exonuclease Cas4